MARVFDIRARLQLSDAMESERDGGRTEYIFTVAECLAARTAQLDDRCPRVQGSSGLSNPWSGMLVALGHIGQATPHGQRYGGWR